MAFNISAQVQLQAPGNVNQVANQIQTQLQNINASINIRIPTGVQTAITQIATGITALNANLNRLNATASTSNTTLNSLNSSLTASNQALAQTSATAAKTTGSIAAASNAMEEFGRVAGVAGRRFLGFTLISNSVISVFNSISSSVKSALNFEREFVKLTQVGEAYRADLIELRSEIDRLSRSFGTSSQELLESSVTLRQAGYSVREVTQALEALSKASLSPSFGNFKELSEGLISIRSQFRLAATDIEGAFSSINAVSNAYAVESKDVLDAVKRTGGAFRSVGGDLNEFIALFTSVRATTRESAESIATGLRTVFTRLQRPELVDNLKAMGINLRYTRDEAIALGNAGLNEQFVGAYESVRRLSSALQGLPSTDARYSKIVEELGGYRQISKVIPLLQEFTTAQNALNIAQSAGASLTVSADQAQQNFLVNLQKIKESFLALTRNLVNSNGFQVFLDSLVKVGNVAVSIFDKVSPLIPLLTTLATIKFASNIGSFFTGIGQGFQGIGPKRYATGGPVSGRGTGDTVPALLTPGEHVLNTRQVYNLGGHANVQRFAEGGEPTFSVGNREFTDKQLRLLYAIAKNRPDSSRLTGARDLLLNPKVQKLLQSIVPRSDKGNYDSGSVKEPYINEILSNIGLKSTSFNYQFAGVQPINKLSEVLEPIPLEVDKGGSKVSNANVQGLLPSLKFRRQLRNIDATARGTIGDRYKIGTNEPFTANDKQALSSIYIQNGNLNAPFLGDSLGLISTANSTKGALDTGPTYARLSQKDISGFSNEELKKYLKERGVKSISGLVQSYATSTTINKDLDKEVNTALEAINAKGLITGNSLKTIRGIIYQDAILQGKYGLKAEHDQESLDVLTAIPAGLRKNLTPQYSSKYADIKGSYSLDNVKDVIRKYLTHLFNQGRLPFASGGVVNGFATGGVVPGSGNTDTVPADLPAGSFVVKKSSAQAIGYDRLASMGRKGFAKGGFADLFDTEEDITKKRVSKFINRFYGKTGVDLTRGLSEIRSYNSQELKAIYGGERDVNGFFDTNTSRLGINQDKSDIEKTILHEGIHGLDLLLGRKAGEASFSSTQKDSKLNKTADEIGQFISPDLAKKGQRTKDYLNKKYELIAFSGQQVLGEDSKGEDTFNSAISAAKRGKIKDTISKSIIRYLASTTGNLGDLGGALNIPRPADDYVGRGRDKLLNTLGTQLFKFASGGRSPQDIVPALLTPGEFVFNRQASQKIGYQNLHHMNRTGEVRGFNDGGRVPLATGTTSSFFPASYVPYQPTGQGPAPLTYAPGSTVPFVGQGRFPVGLQANAYNGIVGTPPNNNTGFQNQLIAAISNLNASLNKNTVANNQASQTAATGQTFFQRHGTLFSLAAGIIATATGYLADQLNKLSGTAQNAVGGGESGFRNARAAGGALNGALIGGGVGFGIGNATGLPGAGIIGGVIGLIGGAIQGFSSSKREAESELSGARLEVAQRNLTDATAIISRRQDGSFNQGELAPIIANLNAGFRAIANKATDDNSSFFGQYVNREGVATQIATQRREFIQSQSPAFNDILTKYSGAQGRLVGQNANLTPEQIRELFSSTGEFANSLRSGQYSTLVNTLAQQPGQSQEGVIAQRTNQARQDALAERARLASLNAIIERDKGLTQFERLADVVSRVTNEMEKFKNEIDLINSVSDGRIASSKFSFGAKGNVLFGVGDERENAQTLRGVGRGIGGEVGQSFSENLIINDQIRRNLFGIIATNFNTNTKDFNQDAFAERIKSLLFASLPGGNNAANSAQVNSVYANLSQLSFDQLKGKVQSGDASGLYNELFKGNELANHYRRITDELEKFINDLGGLVSEYERRQLELGNKQDKVSSSRLDVAQLESRLPFLRQGIEPTGLQGRLSVQQLNQPETDRFNRLAASIQGLRGNEQNPIAIANRQRELNEEIRRVQQDRDSRLQANPQDQTGLGLNRVLAELQRRSSEAGTALRELANSADRNRNAQERLAELNRGQADRGKFVENLITGGVAARVQFNSGIRSYQNLLANRQNITQTPAVIAQDIIRSLRQIGDRPVSEFGADQNFNRLLGDERGSQFTGNQLADRLVREAAPGFVNPPGLDEERNRLLNTIAQNTERAVVANQGIVNNERASQDAFFSRMETLQNSFFAQLRQGTARDQLQIAERNVTIAQGEVNNARTGQRTYETLSGRFGINNQDQLGPLLGANGANLDTLLASRRTQVSRQQAIQSYVSSGNVVNLHQAGVSDFVNFGLQAFRGGHDLRTEDGRRQATSRLRVENNTTSEAAQNISSNAQTARISVDALSRFLDFVERNPGFRRNISNFNDSGNRLENSQSRLDAADLALSNAEGQVNRFTTALTDATSALQLIGARDAAISTGLAGISGGFFRNAGGPIPGVGNTDTVPAMLTPGEFVINARAARNIGLQNLNRLNGVQHFANGGEARLGGMPVPRQPAPQTRQDFILSLVNSGSSIEDAYSLANSVLGTPNSVTQYNRVANQSTEIINRQNPSYNFGRRLDAISSIEQAARVQALGVRQQQTEAAFQVTRDAIAEFEPGRFQQRMNRGFDEDAQMQRILNIQNNFNRPVAPVAQENIASDDVRLQEILERVERENRQRNNSYVSIQRRIDARREVIAGNLQEFRRQNPALNSYTNDAILNGVNIDENRFRTLQRGYNNGRGGFSDLGGVQVAQVIRELATQHGFTDRIPNNNELAYQLRNKTPQEVVDYIRSVLPSGGRPLLSIPQFAEGGLVPGSGNLDTFHAKLTPGELVIDKSTTEKIRQNLQNFNSGVGSSVDFGSVISAMNNFVSGLNPFIDAMKAFPHELVGTFTHTVNMNINGAEVLASLEPSIQQLVVKVASEQLNKYISENLYEAGRP